MTDQELKAAFVAKLKTMPIPSWLDEVDGRIRTYIEGAEIFFGCLIIDKLRKAMEQIRE